MKPRLESLIKNALRGDPRTIAVRVALALVVTIVAALFEADDE